MSVREFTLSRLHCFRSEARVHVAPLTLIFGQNNAGKSTLLRGLALLAGSIGAPSVAALDLSEEAARGASFHDLRSRLDNVNEVAFTLSWANGQLPPETVTLRFMEETDGSHVLRDVVLRGGDVSIDLQISVDVKGHYELVRRGEILWSGPISFSGIRPDSTSALPEELWSALPRLAQRLDKLRSSLVWLSASRATVPRRRPIPSRDPPRRADGSWLQDQLAREAWQSRRTLINAVSSTLGELFDCSLHVDFDERDALLRGSPGQGPWRLPLADMGEGITQVLPVITLCCMAENGDLGDTPILCIEQPEMHLHTDAERALARFVTRVALSAPQPQLVLETHSEILLSEVLLEVAEGRLRPDQLALHWVTRESAITESIVRRIAVDAKGNPEGWPTGAFGQRSELARELFLARRR